METTIMVTAPIAVSEADFNEWGCPYCGYRSAHGFVSTGGAAVLRCGDKDCGKHFHILADGLEQSTIGNGDGNYPQLSDHPRRGIPKHGKPDIRPGNGEYFKSRGTGLDIGECFICGVKKRNSESNHYMNNIAAFVQCKEAGERIVKLFERGAWLDYRERTPDRVQVKVCACDRHLLELRVLNELVRDGIINAERIGQAMATTIKVSELVEEVRPFITSFIKDLGYSAEQAEKFADGYFEEVGKLPLMAKLDALHGKDDRCMTAGFAKAGIDEAEALERSK